MPLRVTPDRNPIFIYQLSSKEYWDLIAVRHENRRLELKIRRLEEEDASNEEQRMDEFMEGMKRLAEDLEKLHERKYREMEERLEGSVLEMKAMYDVLLERMVGYGRGQRESISNFRFEMGELEKKLDRRIDMALESPQDVSEHIPSPQRMQFRGDAPPSPAISDDGLLQGDLQDEHGGVAYYQDEGIFEEEPEAHEQGFSDEEEVADVDEVDLVAEEDEVHEDGVVEDEGGVVWGYRARDSPEVEEEASGDEEDDDELIPKEEETELTLSHLPNIPEGHNLNNEGSESQSDVDDLAGVDGENQESATEYADEEDEADSGPQPIHGSHKEKLVFVSNSDEEVERRRATCQLLMTNMQALSRLYSKVLGPQRNKRDRDGSGDNLLVPERPSKRSRRRDKRSRCEPATEEYSYDSELLIERD